MTREQRSSAPAHHQRALAEVCRGARAPWDARAALVRRLVLSNLRSVLHGVLPRTVDALGARFEEDLTWFLRERGPRTPHVRDVPAEFARAIEARWRAADLTWIAELARFEHTDFRASFAPRSEGVPSDDVVRGELTLDAPLALRGPLLLESFTYAVQEDDAARADPHTLLWYRDDAELARTLRLTPMAAALMRRWMAGECLQDAMVAAATEIGVTLDEPTLTRAAHFLDDLCARGIVLGAALTTAR